MHYDVKCFFDVRCSEPLSESLCASVSESLWVSASESLWVTVVCKSTLHCRKVCNLTSDAVLQCRSVAVSKWVRWVSVPVLVSLCAPVPVSLCFEFQWVSVCVWDGMKHDIFANMVFCALCDGRQLGILCQHGILYQHGILCVLRCHAAWIRLLEKKAGPSAPRLRGQRRVATRPRHQRSKTEKNSWKKA